MVKYCEICKMFLFLDHHLFFFPTISWISSGPTHSSVELVKDPHCHWNWPGISQSHSKLRHRKIPNIFGRSRPSLKVRFFLAGWIIINCFQCQFYRMKRQKPSVFQRQNKLFSKENFSPSTLETFHGSSPKKRQHQLEHG